MIRGKKLRAVSPVIAVLLLIIVSVVAGVAVYSFVTGFISQTTAQSRTPSSIVIDAAKLDESDKEANITVRNVGQVDAKIVAVYVLNASDLSVVDSNSSSGIVTTISPGEVKLITASGLTHFSKNNWYIIKVVTEDGSSATIKVRARP